MIQFSYPRFRNVLRHEWITHRRLYLATFLVLFILQAFVFFLMNQLADFRFGNAVKILWVLIIYPFAACYTLSLTYAHLGRKEQRISNFMLPASNFEKALVRHLVTIIGFNVIFLLSYCLADLVNSFFLSMFYIPIAIDDPEVFIKFLTNQSILDRIGDVFTIWNPGTYMYLSCHVVACSMFIMGSAIFRKLAFLKTILIIWIVNPIILYVCYDKIFGTNGENPVLTTIFCILMLSLAAFITYLAYRRYCRLQVI